MTEQTVAVRSDVPEIADLADRVAGLVAQGLDERS